MVRAIIFDLDDTLISEKKYIESGYRHIAELLSNRYDKGAIELYDMLIDLFNHNPKNVFNRILDTLGVPYTKTEIIELVEEYRNHIPIIDFFNDVLPCLDLLKNKNIKMGVITDGYANAQRNKLMTLNAHSHFDEIIVTDELGRQFWKPHPKAFEIMKEKLNVEFHEMIYVGDNPEKDFYISSVYPIRTIRVYRDGVYTEKSYLKGIKEKHSIQSLSELIKFIQK
jgi:putative hydrolase of the HAD superfamily